MLAWNGAQSSSVLRWRIAACCAAELGCKTGPCVVLVALALALGAVVVDLSAAASLRRGGRRSGGAAGGGHAPPQQQLPAWLGAGLGAPDLLRPLQGQRGGGGGGSRQPRLGGGGGGGGRNAPASSRAPKPKRNVEASASVCEPPTIRSLFLR